MKNFMDMLRNRIASGLNVCVGLDSDLEKIPKAFQNGNRPEDKVLAFNKSIVSATKDLVCAFKPNIAFYSYTDKDTDGGYFMQSALKHTCAYIRETAPDVPIILDAKRGDIGNTNAGYVTEAFDVYGADAVTVTPFLGFEEGIDVFAKQKDKGIIVLCRTSNKGAAEFQNTRIIINDTGEMRELMGNKPLPTNSSEFDLEWFEPGYRGWFIPFYQYVALRVARHWNEHGNCALVVGATAPRELQIVRYLVGDDMPILVPGVGAQGGSLEATLKAGGKNIMVNASRSVIFAYREQRDRGENYTGEDAPILAQKEVIRMNSVITAFHSQSA